MSDLYDYMPANWSPRRLPPALPTRTTCWDDPARCAGCVYCTGGQDEHGRYAGDFTPIQARRVEQGLPPGEPWPARQKGPAL